MTAIRHAASPIVPGYTLCHVTHHGDRKARFATAEESVNCPNCRIVVNFCKTFNEHYRELPLLREVTEGAMRLYKIGHVDGEFLQNLVNRIAAPTAKARMNRVKPR